MIKPAVYGERVGAFMSCDKTMVRFLGYGVYECDEPVPYLDIMDFEGAEQTLLAFIEATGLPMPADLDTEEKRRVKYQEFRQSEAYRMAQTFPKIRLDDGDVVYGNECHFGPEQVVKQLCETRQVQRVVLLRKQNGEPDREAVAGSA